MCHRGGQPGFCIFHDRPACPICRPLAIGAIGRFFHSLAEVREYSHSTEKHSGGGGSLASGEERATAPTESWCAASLTRAYRERRPSDAQDYGDVHVTSGI